MKLEYKNKQVEKQCNNFNYAKRKYPEKIAKKLMRLINFLMAADNLQSIIDSPMFHFHDLKSDKNGFYALDIDGRASQYRLIVSFQDGVTKNQVFQNPITIVDIKIEEVSKHYE